MEITSANFILLSGLSVFLFYLINPKHRAIYLAVISCSFVATYSYYLLIYISVYSLINYFIGLRISYSRHKIAFFRAGVILNLTQLILLKYSSFAIDPIIHIFSQSASITKLSLIIMPVGISYFTLQGIGYLINIKMGWEKPEKRFVYFLLYIIFFPKFLSGPIERSNHFLPQIYLNRSFNEQQITNGLRIILLGLFKKVVIANQLLIAVNTVYSDVSSFGGYYLAMVLLIQPLCLYFDFSGYTDIAIGLGKAFGIDLLPNFNKPFLSENVTSFWKKFHMSLSSWFNDYLFKQICFKYRRWGKYASVFAVFVTFTLFGIWHGAGWSFMILGFIQASALNYEFFTKQKRIKVFSLLPDLFKVWIGRAFTYLFFGCSLVFFFSPDIKTSFLFFSHFADFGNNIHQYFGVSNSLLIAAVICSALFMAYEILENDYKIKYDLIMGYWCKYKFFRFATYYIAISLIFFFSGGVQEFVYSQF